MPVVQFRLGTTNDTSEDVIFFAANKSSKFLNSFKKIIDSKKLKLITTLKLMEANSFQKTLEKGFAIVLDNENNIIKKYDDAKGYQEGKVQFIDGIRKITFKN